MVRWYDLAMLKSPVTDGSNISFLDSEIENEFTCRRFSPIDWFSIVVRGQSSALQSNVYCFLLPFFLLSSCDFPVHWR